MVQRKMRRSRRIFTHFLLYQGEIHKNTIIEIGENGNLRLFPFENEIADTVFISGVVFVCKENLSEKHIQEICKILDLETNINIKAQEINNYLKKNNLYHASNRYEILYYNAGRVMKFEINKNSL